MIFSGNLAFGKTTWQSTVFANPVDILGGRTVSWYPSHAVDGRLSDGINEYYECAETQIDGHQSWWMVDLGQLHTVYNVSIAAPSKCMY